MKITDTVHLPLPRERVFAALNDADVLRRAIPGCESLERVSETQFEATVAAKIGPVRAKFTGNVQLSDLDPPESYTISGEGKGGAAGFAKGGARVTLTEEDGGTRLDYAVDAQVGGKLAQVGARLIEGSTRKLAGEFFSAFETVAGEVAPGTVSVTAPAETPAAPAKPAKLDVDVPVVLATAVAVLVAFLFSL